MVSSFPVVAGGPLRPVTTHPRRPPIIPKEESVLTQVRLGGQAGRRKGSLRPACLPPASSRCRRRYSAVGTAGASSALGAAHPATLPAVTIGLISDGGGTSSIGTAALEEQGARLPSPTRTSTRTGSRATRSISTSARTSRRRPAARPAPTTWSSTAWSLSSSPSPDRARPRCRQSSAPASPTSRSAGRRRPS